MAEQKKRGRSSAKTTEKTEKIPKEKKTVSADTKTGKTAKRSANTKRESEEKQELPALPERELPQKKETTKMTARGKRFGDSILDEVILILIILASVVVFVSLVTDKMGIFGMMIADFFKGVMGFGGLLFPAFLIAFCVWMLFSEERKHPIVRGSGTVLFLVTIASLAQIINPINVAENAGFMKRCDTLYSYGAFGNGGLIGGLVGGGLYAVLDTLGSYIVLLTVLLISVVMATGKSFFHAIGDANDYRRSRKQAKREKIKQRAERVRQQEIREEERLERRVERRMAKQEKLEKQEQRRKKMSRSDFNIEIDRRVQEEGPYIQETVFREHSRQLESKKREPIYDYVKEMEQPVPAEPTAQKAEAEEAYTEPLITEAVKPMTSRRAEAREAIAAAAVVPHMPAESKKTEPAPVRTAPRAETVQPMANKTEAPAGSRFKEEPARPAKPVFDDTPIIDILPEEDMGKTVLPAAMMPQAKQESFSIDAVIEEEPVSEAAFTEEIPAEVFAEPLTSEVFADETEEALPVRAEIVDSGEEIPIVVEESAFAEEEIIRNWNYGNESYSFAYKSEFVKSCLCDSGSVLEQYTFLQEQDNAGNVDCRVGVHIDWDGMIHTEKSKDVLNEIDVLSMYGNVPVFISCKGGSVDQNALYELDAVTSRFGGKYAKKVLVVSKPLSKGHTLRAEEMGIEVRVVE